MSVTFWTSQAPALSLQCPSALLLSWLLKGHLVLGRASLCRGLQPEPVLEMAQQQGEFWHKFMSSPKPIHFPPKTERGGERSSSPPSMMPKKTQTLSFINTELSPDSSWLSSLPSKGGLYCPPAESWLGWIVGHCSHPGLGGDLFCLPSQQKEKNFLSSLLP